MNKRLAGLGFCVVLAASFTAGEAPAQQGLEPYDLAGDWEVSASRGADGAFEVCLATLPYEDGEAVIFYSDSERLTLGLLLERWQLDARDEYDIALQFGDHPRLPAKGYAAEDKKGILIDRDFTPEADQIREGGDLYLHTPAGSLRYDISGAAAALDALFSCADDNKADAAQ